MNPMEEFYKALKMVEEEDRKRLPIVKEYRIYYDENGVVTAFSECEHPAGDNYIVVDHPDQFHKANTLLLRVVDKKLITLDTKMSDKVRLKKSTQGQPVVKGMAAVALGLNEEYLEIEYYDQTNN
jgi:hypothetical protein